MCEAYEGRESLALIPLRAGSKGLPGKNVRLLGGRPLYEHATEQARAAGITRIVISTDIEDLILAPPRPDVMVLPRPPELAGDTVPMDAVLRHVLIEVIAGPARVVLLQATSPLRHRSDIQAAVNLHRQGGFDLVLTASRGDSGVLKWGRSDGVHFVPLSNPSHCFANRAELPPIYRPNGAVYVFDADWFRASGTLAAKRIGMIEMPVDRSLDIDSLADFEEAEAQLRTRDSSSSAPYALDCRKT